MTNEELMQKILTGFNDIKHYEQKRGFLEDLNYHIGQIKYFYDELTPNQQGIHLLLFIDLNNYLKFIKLHTLT